MSIRVMAKVWEHADVAAGKLIVLLAMADWGDDSGGHIYPSHERLGLKARVSKRHARRLVRELSIATENFPFLRLKIAHFGRVVWPVGTVFGLPHSIEL